MYGASTHTLRRIANEQKLVRTNKSGKLNALRLALALSSSCAMLFWKSIFRWWHLLYTTAFLPHLALALPFSFCVCFFFSLRLDAIVLRRWWIINIAWRLKLPDLLTSDFFSLSLRYCFVVRMVIFENLRYQNFTTQYQQQWEMAPIRTAPNTINCFWWFSCVQNNKNRKNTIW